MTDHPSRQPPPLPTRRSDRPTPESGSAESSGVTSALETAVQSVQPGLPPPPDSTFDAPAEAPWPNAPEPRAWPEPHAGALPDQDSQEVLRPPPSELPTIGTDLLWSKKIKVTEELDRGGMSYVVRGVDMTLLRELALKVSPAPRKQMPRAQLARFIEEAQITAQLEHPNVVPVHEIGLDPEGRVYFSMKLVRGQSLETILEKRREGDPKTVAEFGLRRLLDVFLQVCQALEYAHARGVIHRDLKPSNVMVGDFGEVLVMDWGVAKVLDRARTLGSVTTAPIDKTLTVAEEGAVVRHESLPPQSIPSPVSDVTSVRAGKEALATQAGVLIGTPAYMSPEQARGKSADERSDLYSLGVVLFEILCDRLPFDEEDPRALLLKMLSEPPPRPSSINRATPLALETLALRLLEKDPERRTLTLMEIRTHVQNYIEGIGRDYRVQRLWTSVLWAIGGMSLFAFLVWYLTGQSIALLFAIAPGTVFNAVGWFLVVVALGRPLWSVYLALRQTGDRDRFRPPTPDETFVTGFFAHRTFATAVAPLFQLVFIVEIVMLALARVSFGRLPSAEHAQRLTTELRADWAQSLMVILVFLFGYLFFLSSEVRFARQINHYDALITRPRWEAVWPFFLIIVLLLTIGTTQVLDWALAPDRGNVRQFFRQQVLTPPLDLVEIGKTFVFQGTFLSALVLGTLLLAFPLAEILAALRLPYQPADEASVAQRSQYFVRSVAIFRVARVNWLYGGAMIGSLTAMTILSQPVAAPLVKQVLYILGPSLIGFFGYALTRRHVRRFLDHAPAVENLLRRQSETFRAEQDQIVVERLTHASWRLRLVQLVVPVACIVLYLLWTGSGVHKRSVQQLIMPVTTEGWLLILPYVLLVPLLVVRDDWQLRRLRRRLDKPPTDLGAPQGFSAPPAPPAAP